MAYKCGGRLLEAVGSGAAKQYNRACETTALTIIGIRRNGMLKDTAEKYYFDNYNYKIYNSNYNIDNKIYFHLNFYFLNNYSYFFGSHFVHWNKY